MKVLQVLPRIATESSGPSYSVTRLCDALVEEGAEVAMHVLEPVPSGKRRFQFVVHPTLSLPFAYRLGLSPAMKKGLYQAAPGATIIHNHSMWMMPNIYSYQAAKKAGCKYIFSPRGTLSEWAFNRSRFRKALVWRMGQKAALFGADCLHATSEKELAEIRNAGLTAPVAVIPNGVDVPGMDELQLKKPGKRILLFLSRIHPAKGIDNLLMTWRELQGHFPDWNLQITGPLAGAYPQRMQSLANELELERVVFTGELRGSGKAAAFFNADLFVLPTRSENFGVAIAEALGHAVPVITTKAAPWKGIETHSCGWWIDEGQQALFEALAEAMQLPAEKLMAMGQPGREWMRQDYSWHSIGKRMLTTYQWLLGEASRPDWVVE